MKIEFKTDLVLKSKLGHSSYTVYKDMVYSINGKELTVNKGFKTDLASVPWFVQWLVPRSGKHDEASVLHDAIYVSLRGLERGKLYKNLKKADLIFYFAMKELGVNLIRRVSAYIGVRLFGWTKFI